MATLVLADIFLLKKVAFVHKWLSYRGWSLNNSINIEKLGIRLAVVDRWPLFRGFINNL
jgi:hypothetical protein